MADGSPIRAQAVAAALLFRLLTNVLQIPLGGATYLIWQRNKTWRTPVNLEDPIPIQVPSS